MVSGEGIEPSANRLKVYCSTAELPAHIAKKMARHTSAPFSSTEHPALFGENASLQAKTVCKLRSDNSLHLSQPVFSRKNRPVSSYGLRNRRARQSRCSTGMLKRKIVGKAVEPEKSARSAARGKERQMVMPGSTGTAQASAEISVAKPHAYAGLEWQARQW